VAPTEIDLMPDTSTAIAQCILCSTAAIPAKRVRCCTRLIAMSRPLPTSVRTPSAQGYEQRVRATVRELVKQHFFQEAAGHGPAGQ
jgi:hypothetical protein